MHAHDTTLIRWEFVNSKRWYSHRCKSMVALRSSDCNSFSEAGLEHLSLFRHSDTRNENESDSWPKLTNQVAVQCFHIHIHSGWVATRAQLYHSNSDSASRVFPLIVCTHYYKQTTLFYVIVTLDQFKSYFWEIQNVKLKYLTLCSSCEKYSRKYYLGVL